MDGPATHRSLRLGIDAELHRPRARLCLWRSFYPAASRHGHSGPANRATLAMAERTYGTADRLDPAGMSRPCRRLRRAASASPPHFLYGLLQRRENTPFPEQRCASPTGCSGHRAHSSDSNSRRVTPSIYSDLISDMDNGNIHLLPQGTPDVMRLCADVMNKLFAGCSNGRKA